jgi:hypothetical protein
MSKPPNEFFFAASTFTEHIISKMMMSRIESMLPTFTETLKIQANTKAWTSFLQDFEGNSDYLTMNMTEDTGNLIYKLDGGNILIWSISNSTISIVFQGSKAFVVDMPAKILSKGFIKASATVEWIYSNSGESVNISVRSDRTPISEMFSFLKGESLASYYDRFLESSASILLLIGKPGTGKTSFIRGLLQHASLNAMVAYDPAVLSKDYVFASFVEGDAGVFVIEDADILLSARKDGNDMMHRLLNVGEGLVTAQGKKMIFSTNLPSVKDIDPALVRPGRCYDILNFEELSYQQAKIFCEKVNIEMPDTKKDSYTLAELYHQQEHAKKTSSKGFGFL